MPLLFFDCSNNDNKFPGTNRSERFASIFGRKLLLVALHDMTLFIISANFTNNNNSIFTKTHIKLTSKILA